MATAEQIIARVRVELGDDKQPFRFASPEILTWMRDGEREIVQKRPEALYIGTGIVTALPAQHLTSPTASVNVAERYETALVFYICYRALAVDAEHAANSQLSQSFYTKFGGLLL